MAEREMLAIIKRARERWSLRHVAISHRVGVVPAAESSVEIAISSTHRREALEAVHFAIDELKARVPIWKKEVYAAEAARWKENVESVRTLLSRRKLAMPPCPLSVCLLSRPGSILVAAVGPDDCTARAER